MEKNSCIYVAGHTGMVGSAVVRALSAAGYTNLLIRSSKELDLRNYSTVSEFFKYNQPEYVFLCAAKVGGIKANNTYRADFIMDNLLIECNVMNAARLCGVKKLLFLGSSCIYPKDCPQPIKEEHLLSGYLELTNEPYAIAKIAGLKMAEAFRDQYGCNFISVMPSNLYGPNDNYDPEQSHMIAALIRKFYEAKTQQKSCVVIWGTGRPRRELLHVDDLAAACLMLMNGYNERQFLNVGMGDDLSVQQIATLLQDISDYRGEIIYNGELDGTMRKLLDCSRINALGWHPTITPEQGLRETYMLYKNMCSGS